MTLQDALSVTTIVKRVNWDKWKLYGSFAIAPDDLWASDWIALIQTPGGTDYVLLEDMTKITHNQYKRRHVL